MPLRSDAGVAVDGAEADDDERAVRVAREHVAAALAAERLGQAVGRVHERTEPAPPVISNASPATIALSDHSAPLRRWQRLQWQ